MIRNNHAEGALSTQVHFRHALHKTKRKRQRKKHEKPISGRFSRQLEPTTALSIILYFHFLTVRHESSRKFKTPSLLFKKKRENPDMLITLESYNWTIVFLVMLLVYSEAFSDLKHSVEVGYVSWRSDNRELKIWRRQRQRQRHKSMIWLVEWRKIIVLHVQHAFWCNVLT